MVIQELTERRVLENSLKNKRGTVLFFYCSCCPLWEKRKQNLSDTVQDFSDDIDFFQCDIHRANLWKDFSIESSPSIFYFYKGEVYIIERYIPESEDMIPILENIVDDSAKEDLEFIAKIKQAADSEKIMSEYYDYIASTTTNGKIKRLFTNMSEEAQRHAKMLRNFIEHFNGEIYHYVPREIYDRVGEPESFSLLGAVKMALKLEKQSFVFYKRMAVLTDDELFKKMVKDEKEHMKILKKEIDFLKNKEVFEEIDVQIKNNSLTIFLNKI